jgi:ankyrin repeat protein
MSNQKLNQNLFHRGCISESEIRIWALRVLTLLGVLASCWPSCAFARVHLQNAESCETPLIKAIRRRENVEIQRLIKSGVNLNEKVCPEGNTALFEALGSQPEVAKALVIAGANPNETGSDGGTPLMTAAYYCLDDVASLLLEKGAAVNASNSNGSTPLMQAASQCMDGKMVAFLLRSGALVNSKNKIGQTALTTAAFYGNESAVMELVAAGADVNVKTNQGETALSMAQYRDVGRKPSHDRICEFLRMFDSLTRRKSSSNDNS